jgi:hypothetical protein
VLSRQELVAKHVLLEAPGRHAQDSCRLSQRGNEAQARRFQNSFKDKHRGIVDSHLFEIPEEFPAAIFLLTYYDMQASYSGKAVIRAGKAIQEVFDGNQQAQAVDWVLLDIFAPFRAEYERQRYAAESDGAPVLEQMGG